jgi:hypothetical protein
MNLWTRGARGEVSLLLLVLGCAEIPSSDPLEVTLRGSERLLTFEVSAPEISEGLNELTIRVTEDGAPVSGLELAVVASMAVHDHEAKPARTRAEDAGLYRAEVVFSMPGTWSVDVRAEGDVADSCVILVEVD